MAEIARLDRFSAKKSLHWIHYRCDKLSDKEIRLIENDQEYKYTCRGCKEKHTENVNLRVKAESIKKCRWYSDQTVTDLDHAAGERVSQTDNDSPELKTMAESILEEERSLNICYNCEEGIHERESLVYDICNGVCHLNCLSDSEIGLVYYACKASVEQVTLMENCINSTSTLTLIDGNTAGNEEFIAGQRGRAIIIVEVRVGGQDLMGVS